MANVMVKCPKTGKLVYTGVSMDKTSFETAIIENSYLRCPECRKYHVWSKKDAVLKH